MEGRFFFKTFGHYLFGLVVLCLFIYFDYWFFIHAILKENATDGATFFVYLVVTIILICLIIRLFWIFRPKKK